MHTSNVFQCHCHSAQRVILGDYIDAKLSHFKNTATVSGYVWQCVTTGEWISPPRSSGDACAGCWPRRQATACTLCFSQRRVFTQPPAPGRHITVWRHQSSAGSGYWAAAVSCLLCPPGGRVTLLSGCRGRGKIRNSLIYQLCWSHTRNFHIVVISIETILISFYIMMIVMFYFIPPQVWARGAKQVCSTRLSGN